LSIATNVKNLLLKIGLGRAPTEVPAEDVQMLSKLSPDDLATFKRLGIAPQDLTRMIYKNTQVSMDRGGFYKEVDRAILHPLMGAAVDLFAGVATTYSKLHGATVWVTSQNRKVQNELTKLLDRIGIEERIFDWAWTTAAYGDLFIKIDGMPGTGVVAVDDDNHPLNISRLDYNGRLIGFFETPLGATLGRSRKLLPPWDYVHCRILGAKKKRPQADDPTYIEYTTVNIMAPDTRRVTSRYGTSVLTNAMPIYKRLRLTEDSIMLARLSKGILRYLYKVQVDNTNSEAVIDMIDEYKTLLQRARAISLDADSPYYDEKYCLRGNMQLILLNGEEPCIKEMAESPETYKGLYILSVNSKTLQLEPDKIIQVQKTRLNAQLVRVHLDNGKYIDCTPDHPFMLRNGEFKKAENLVGGESLMPYYSKVAIKGLVGYRLVYNPCSNLFCHEHRLVGKYVYGKLKKGDTIHHIDFDKENNDPSNLKLMGNNEHWRYHSKLGKERWLGYSEEERAEKGQSISKRAKDRWATLEFRTKVKGKMGCKLGSKQKNKRLYTDKEAFATMQSENLKGLWAQPKYRENQIRALTGRRYSLRNVPSRIRDELGRFVGALNHKVVRVERLNFKEDTYDITTERNHNFPLKAGVFVHNSPLGVNEDIILPVFGDVNNIAIEKLGGETDIRFIADLTEQRNQLACALKTPLQLLGGYVEEMPQGIGRSAIERYDIRFAREARRVQRALIDTQTRLCQIHLAYMGLDPDPKTFQVNMSETSSAEEEELSLTLEKEVTVVKDLVDLVVDTIGPNVDRLKLLKYFNDKILKLEDFDLNQMLKAVDKQIPLEKKHIIAEAHRALMNTDLKALLPIDRIKSSIKEGKKNRQRALNNLWESRYKNTKIAFDKKTRQMVATVAKNDRGKK